MPEKHSWEFEEWAGRDLAIKLVPDSPWVPLGARWQHTAPDPRLIRPSGQKQTQGRFNEQPTAMQPGISWQRNLQFCGLYLSLTGLWFPSKLSPVSLREKQ